MTMHLVCQVTLLMGLLAFTRQVSAELRPMGHRTVARRGVTCPDPRYEYVTASSTRDPGETISGEEVLSIKQGDKVRVYTLRLEVSHSELMSRLWPA